MSSTSEIIRVVGRATGRVRFWRLADALIKAALFCLPPALLLFALDRFVPIPGIILAIPPIAFVVFFAVCAVKGLSKVNQYEVAKLIDDRKNLKDQLTSALYFSKLGYSEGLAEAAITRAESLAAEANISSIPLGSWPRFSRRLAIAAALTILLAVFPRDLLSLFDSTDSDSTQTVKTITTHQDNTDAAPDDNEEQPAKPIEHTRETTEIARLETERPPERDPSTMDTDMSDDLLDDIESIKASIDASELKGMEDAFKDDDKKGPVDERNEKPPRIAPLDKELLEDIARGEKKKVGKDDKGADGAIGIAVKMPAKPGARQRGPRKPGQGSHGGGDVGESGDTQGPPRRTPIAGRDKLIIDSRKSKDIIEKSDLEQIVMNELMMRFSMKDITMTGTAKDVKVGFSEQKRDPVVQETIPHGMRGYVQRYFAGMGGRRTEKTSTTKPTPKPETN